MYIGKEPIVGNFQVCDAISVVNGQAAYTMQVSSTNVVPESVNHMLVSLNGILQKPGSSFTVSGSTITFASALATGDVIDFIMLLGNVLDLGVPSDATVTDAKANFVSTSSGAGLQIKGDGTTDGTLQLNCSQNSHGIKLKSPSHSAGQSYTLTFPTTAPSSGKALVTDGSGNLSFSSAGGLNLISTTNVTSGTANVDITSGIDSTYTNYMVSLTNIHPASDHVLKMRVFTGTGGSQAVDTGNNYQMNMIAMRIARSSIIIDSNSGADAFEIPKGQYIDSGSDGACLNANLFIYNPSNTTFQTFVEGNYAMENTTSNYLTSGHCALKYTQTTAVTGLRFFMGSGNIDNAIIKLYGIS